VTVFVCAIVTAILHRRQIPLIGFLFYHPQL